MNNQVLEETVLKKVMKNIPIGLVVSKEGEQRRLYYVNPTAYEMIGYTKEEYIEKVERGWGSFLNVDLKEVIELNQDKISSGEPFEVMASTVAKNGQEKWLLNQVVVQMEREPICYISIMDVTDKVELERIRQKERELLRKQAAQDSLTKLLNRGTMEEQIDSVLKQGDRSVNHAYISLDVDDFKQINDIYGHCVGDLLILELSDLLKEAFGEKGYTARMGGDEFAVFAINVSREEILDAARCLARRFRAGKDRIGLTEEPSVSIGIAFYPEAGTSFQELYNSADEALYRVKNEGKNGIAVFK